MVIERTVGWEHEGEPFRVTFNTEGGEPVFLSVREDRPGGKERPELLSLAATELLDEAMLDERERQLGSYDTREEAEFVQ